MVIVVDDGRDVKMRNLFAPLRVALSVWSACLAQRKFRAGFGAET